jgi:signal transduction histidine kinase
VKLWEHWSGAAAVAVTAGALGLLAVWYRPFDDSWLALTWGIGGALALVAGNGYRTRRDPSLMLIAAGAAALTSWFLVATISDAVRSTSETFSADTWLVALGKYGPIVGAITFAACLAFTVPWRDRRGRPPLRPSTVTVLVAVPNIGAAILVGALLPVGSDVVYRVEAVVLAALALVSAARAITRGGWHRWVGGASFALLLVAAALWLLVSEDPSRWSTEVALLWFAYLPSVAVVATLLGVLSSQRTEAVRQRRASDRAAQVMEGRAEIASIVAHDVRGPAGTIRSVAGSLRTSYARLGDAERLEFVGMIEQESLRLLRVADQMSLGLKTDAGTLPFHLVIRDLEGPVLQGVHDAEVGNRDVRVEVDPDVQARIDDRWLAEAVRQGLENAMKFSPPGEPIDVRGRSEEATAVLEIEDRGPGIPEDMRETVFQKFCRWRPNGYEDRPGSGLGLFVVRSIAREHGGEAVVATGAHGGTILQIRLPLEGLK